MLTWLAVFTSCRYPFNSHCYGSSWDNMLFVFVDFCMYCIIGRGTGHEPTEPNRHFVVSWTPHLIQLIIEICLPRSTACLSIHLSPADETFPFTFTFLRAPKVSQRMGSKLLQHGPTDRQTEQNRTKWFFVFFFSFWLLLSRQTISTPVVQWVVNVCILDVGRSKLIMIACWLAGAAAGHVVFIVCILLLRSFPFCESALCCVWHAGTNYTIAALHSTCP